MLRKSIELQPEASRTNTQLAVLEILCGDSAAALEQARQETDAFWRVHALALASLASYAAGGQVQADTDSRR